MKFYNREKELSFLNTQYNQLNDSSKMTVLTGRRRIGKTFLANKFTEDKEFVYLFALTILWMVSIQLKQFFCNYAYYINYNR